MAGIGLEDDAFIDLLEPFTADDDDDDSPNTLKDLLSWGLNV